MTQHDTPFTWTCPEGHRQAIGADQRRQFQELTDSHVTLPCTECRRSYLQHEAEEAAFYAWLEQ